MGRKIVLLVCGLKKPIFGANDRVFGIFNPSEQRRRAHPQDLDQLLNLFYGKKKDMRKDPGRVQREAA